MGPVTQLDIQLVLGARVYSTLPLCLAPLAPPPDPAQAALYGLLKKVRDLGMPLISVNRVEPGQEDVADAEQ